MTLHGTTTTTTKNPSAIVLTLGSKVVLYCIEEEEEEAHIHTHARTHARTHAHTHARTHARCLLTKKQQLDNADLLVSAAIQNRCYNSIKAGPSLPVCCDSDTDQVDRITVSLYGHLSPLRLAVVSKSRDLFTLSYRGLFPARLTKRQTGSRLYHVNSFRVTFA